jgi:hypothetical protein
MTTRSWRFYVGRALETGRNPVGARSFAGALRGAEPSMFALAGMLAGNFGAVIHDGLLGLRHGDRLPPGLRAREPPPTRPAGAGTAPPSLCGAGAASPSVRGRGRPLLGHRRAGGVSSTDAK